MRKAAILIAVLPLLALTACVPYYAGTYYEEPGVSAGVSVSVPVLPPVVVLESRPYYTYGGYYYYWDTDRGFWLYSNARRGPWYRLPHSHYPERFQYRGQWHEGRGRGLERGRGRGHDRD
ncbi:MAG: hypothetical protein ACM3NF_10760 [Gemmatimonadota bacterium]